MPRSEIKDESKALLLGRTPEIQFASLGLAEECLLRLGFTEEDAKHLVARIREGTRFALKGEGGPPPAWMVPPSRSKFSRTMVVTEKTSAHSANNATTQCGG